MTKALPTVDEDIIQIEEHFYIRATSSRADERTRVLKHGDTFGVFDRFGDVHPVGLGEQGIFHDGTRHLSRLELRIDRVRPLLLSSTVNEANDVLAVDLTNPDLTGTDGALLVPRGCLHVNRAKLIWQGTCHERLQLANYGMKALSLSILVRYDADFVDIFEVRGSRRARRGRRLPDQVAQESCLLGYEGLDSVVRTTFIEVWPRPAELGGAFARFDVELRPQATTALYVAVTCGAGAPASRAGDDRLPAAYEAAHAALGRTFTQAEERHAAVHTGNEHFNEWLGRSRSDLQMMMTTTPHGVYPYAGVPWFSTVFGRDGIITALQLLWLAPEVARGVLAHLAATQADAFDPVRDAEPGKILHESRTGEMAALGEVPFGRYYGSVDSTPLFVLLAGAYFRRTADLAFVREIWPNVERALAWIDTHGDADGDGFVEYARRSLNGLIQQGWKDSHDSVFHADGTMAEGPIALCEVQAYVYGARLGAADLAEALGDLPRALRLRDGAESLRERFEAAFWSDELGTYALALDGGKRPCLVRSSNAGHCLFTGLVREDRACRTARTLLDYASFSGWGIRTLAASEVRYNPMSYHNGSVWPHDNALIAAGFARYGLRGEAAVVLEAMSQAAEFLDLHRLPELFCGFERRSGEGPTLYPVACMPQAWASGAVYMLLEACLGLTIDGRLAEVRFDNPVLPEWLPAVRITNLSVGDATVDLLLERHPHDVGVTVLRREGRVRVGVVK